jgi:hypothetical protein
MPTLGLMIIGVVTSFGDSSEGTFKIEITGKRADRSECMATKRKMIHIYATGVEKAEIENRASESGKSVSKYLLELAMSTAKEQPRRVRIKKPDRSKVVDIPGPPADDVERGFHDHPSKR